jgi:DNA-directed RNA polymerase specialized sigma24 family protein
MAKDRRPAAAARIQRAARRLRPIEREVLMLSAGEGLCNEAVAERLGISSAAAERLLALVLYKLDRELQLRQRPWWRLR